MKKIGILCASDTELEPFLQQIEDAAVTERAMLKFHEGTIGGTPIVAAFSGVCKVNAAIAAQVLIDHFSVSIIINAGVAGGISKNVQLFDTVISEQVSYHDMADDILTEFHPWLPTNSFWSDERLLEIARNHSRASSHTILFGATVTGEQFVEDDLRDQIAERFSPLSTDMETAAIAHVCYVNRLPFLAVRTVTDALSSNRPENFEQNCEAASKISADIVISLIGMIELDQF